MERYAKRTTSLQAALLLVSVVLIFRIGATSEGVVVSGLDEVNTTLADGSAAQMENTADLHSSSQPDVSHRVFTDVNMGGHRLVEIFEDRNTSEVTNCNILGDETLIKELLPTIPKDVLKDVTTSEMDKFVDKCLDQPTKSEGSSLLDFLEEAFHSLVIVPGTKWCGPGDIAKEYDDLGSARSTDMCCRDHDHSLDNIPAFGKKHGLTNVLFYTMTNCADDHKFFNCLLNDSSPLSVVVGIGYFDVLKTRCFEFGYHTKCIKFNPLRALLLQLPCEEREVDTSRPEEWHFDASPSFLDAFFQSEQQKFLGNRNVSEANSLQESRNSQC